MPRATNLRPLFIAITLQLSCSSLTFAATEQRSTLTDQQQVAVTIYNENLALVKDQRKVSLSSGNNILAIRDVSAQIRPETALLRSLTNAGSVKVTEQNFDFDLLTPEKLLEKFVGNTVTIIKTNPATGAETSEQAQVLSANNGVVLKIGNRIETGLPGRIAFNSVPDNLRDRPTLVLQLKNNGAEQQLLELSYLTGGLGWKADYVAELNSKEDQLDLSGWVTLTNTSGTSYNNAKLQLVAGDINRAPQPQQPQMKLERGMVAMAMADSAAPMAEESLLEYHLYTLDHLTTLAENQTKQVALLAASSVPANKKLILQGANYYYQSSYGEIGQKMKVGVFLEFDNKEASQLGMPLPKGTIRVYKKDKAGNAQFIGEDNIDHTAKNEKIRLKLGNSFDVNADKTQTDFNIIDDGSKGHAIYESAYSIVLKNGKNEDQTVSVQEPIPGDWQIIKESETSIKAASNTATWKIKVPAEGKSTLTYRVRVKY